MVFWDYAVITVYFAVMAGIGVWAMRGVQVQEDYFMGGRSFGKIMQTFAAFGAGTGSSDPVNTARTTFTSGMSGMWSVMYWLFVTPFYWITAVWYRRMRHLTLGDWFVERYESRALGAAYTVFGLLFFIIYGSMMFSAIGKVAAPLVGQGSFSLLGRELGIEYILVPIIGGVVLVYGTLGGLRAAYATDVLQGLCIILLSILLVPFGLWKLVEQFGDPATEGMLAGFRIMHEQLPETQFALVGGTGTSEFPWYFIVAVVVINLVGVVVQPHFIATGGGSAKTEMNARVGLILGNFLKRLCTVGWVLTALVALALFADHPELAADPDKTWGIASRELLGPGLTGLMLACLLAALMSSADAYMVVGSALVVRNIYAAYLNPTATEQQYVKLGRLTGVIVVGGSVLVSLSIMDVFEQLQLTWIVTILFAAPFWIGILWRRATTAAAWTTVVFSALLVFLGPWLAPKFWPALRTRPALCRSNDTVQTTIRRLASPSDVKRRLATIELWDQASAQMQAADDGVLRAFAEGPRRQGPAAGQPAPQGADELPSAARLRLQSEALGQLAAAKARLEACGRRPDPIQVGAEIEEQVVTGGRSIFWSAGTVVIDSGADAQTQPVGPVKDLDEKTTVRIFRYPDDLRRRGQGSLKIDLVAFQWLGMDLTTKSDAMLKTLELLPKTFLPFIVMILVSLVTPRNTPEALDRYYAKMRTPVSPDPAQDRKALEQAYARKDQGKQDKLFPESDLEIQRPTTVDVAGFLVCFAACFAIIGLAALVAGIGS